MKKFLSIATALLYSTILTQATPYASGVTNDNGTVYFFLNEEADSVKVTFNNNASTNDLGALERGRYSFALDTATNFQIYVSKVSGGGFVRTNGAVNTVAGTTNAAGQLITNSIGFPLQISRDTNVLLNLPSPRGLAVNRDPKSAYFGRIYIANGLAGTTSSNPPIARVVGDGIYVVNPDQSDSGLNLNDTPLSGGLTFGNSANNPYKLHVGQDNNLYIADFSDASGTVYVTDPDVSFGQDALGGPAGGPFPVTSARIHGSINAVVAQGSLAGNNLQLWVVDEDLQADPATATATQLNSLWRHDIGGSFPGPFVFPARVFSPSGQSGIASTAQVNDLDRNVGGNFYYTDNRSAGNDTSGLVVRNSSGGTTLWNSRPTSTNMNGGTIDILKTAYSVGVSADQKYVAVMRQDARTWILPLTNGVPDLSRRLWIATLPAFTSARQVKFDAAGNLYVTSNGSELVRIFSPGGTTLTVTGGDVTGTNGTFKLFASPVFRANPTNQTLNAGAALTMVGYVEGMGTVNYQWKLNGTNISGATGVFYTKSNIQQTNAGNYTMVASNDLGVVSSSIGSLTVVDVAPAITVQPTNRTVFAGSNVVFTVTAVGSDPKTYQWFFEGNPISAATASSYTRSNAQSTNQGNYSVTVSNFVGGPVTSDSAFLTVTDSGPVVYTNPTSRTNGAGANSTFTVATFGTDPRTYQWQFGGVNIPNATGTSYTRTNIQIGVDDGDYTVVVSNQFDVATSLPGTLFITNRAPVISTQPKSATNNVGTSVTFTVTAVGTDPIAYQWLFGGNPIAGANNSSYNIPSVDLTNGGNYSVVLTNVIGTNTSTTAILTVNAPVVTAPVIQPLAGAATANVVITWSSVNGNTYRVQYNPDFTTTNWTTLGDIVATGSTSSTTNNPGIADQRYYRVILLQP